LNQRLLLWQLAFFDKIKELEQEAGTGPAAAVDTDGANANRNQLLSKGRKALQR
jgi:hypothetical protein